MRSDISKPRRNVLIGAAAGVAAALMDVAADAQMQVPEPASDAAPSVVAFNGKLYAVWRDPGSDGLWFAAFDGGQWSAKARIARAESSAAPAVAAFDDKLYAVWKGRNTDQRLWYASFDGAEWSQHAQIPDVASSGAPSLCVFDRRLYAAWKASGPDAGFAAATFDGKSWTASSVAPLVVSAPIPPNLHPFTPQMIASAGLSGAGGVDQGKHNDCVFEASAAAVATTARGQQAISKAIVQNPDTSYTVTFPGAPQRPIRVTQSDIATIGAHDSATWAAVLETALILSEPDFANGGRLPPNATGAADGSRPTPAQYALHLLTGSPTARDVAASPRIGARITRALDSGQPVVAFCANNDDGALVSGHEWTMMACDPQADRVTLRNPWGKFQESGNIEGRRHLRRQRRSLHDAGAFRPVLQRGHLRLFHGLGGAESRLSVRLI